MLIVCKRQPATGAPPGVAAGVKAVECHADLWTKGALHQSEEGGQAKRGFSAPVLLYQQQPAYVKKTSLFDNALGVDDFSHSR